MWAEEVMAVVSAIWVRLGQTAGQREPRGQFQHLHKPPSPRHQGSGLEVGGVSCVLPVSPTSPCASSAGALLTQARRGRKGQEGSVPAPGGIMLATPPTVPRTNF